MAPPPPELMEELVEEVLLRFHPNDPASLLHAALVCKAWCHLVCGASFRRRFRRRFREFHGSAAPMLGLFVMHQPISYFARTTSSPPARRIGADRHGLHDGWRVMDARHGRVLLYRRRPCPANEDPFWGVPSDLLVWDPVTEKQRNLPEPPVRRVNIAAVACAATGGGDCDHLDCCRGPFLVLVIGTLGTNMRLSVYSFKAGAWSEVTVCYECSFVPKNMLNTGLGVLMRSALYILVHFVQDNLMRQTIKHHHVIVKYDLATGQVSTIQLPPKFRHWRRSVELITDDDGGLGFVVVVSNELQLWSRVAGPDGGVAGFVLTRTIDLLKVLPSTLYQNKKKQPQLNGFVVDGASRFLFISKPDTRDLYSIEMNSSQVREVAKCYCGHYGVIPYTSFCTPITSRVQH